MSPNIYITDQGCRETKRLGSTAIFQFQAVSILCGQQFYVYTYTRIRVCLIIRCMVSWRPAFANHFLLANPQTEKRKLAYPRLGTLVVDQCCTIFYKWHIMKARIVIPASSIEYPSTRRFDLILEYSNFRVIAPSIRVSNCSWVDSKLYLRDLQYQNNNFYYQS